MRNQDLPGKSDLPRALSWAARRKLVAYSFLTPALLVICIFVLFPIARAIVISLHSWDLIGAPRFVGIRNYDQLLNSVSFRSVIAKTFEFVLLTVPTNIVFALILAIALNRGMRFVNLWRGIIFLPAVTSMVAIGRLWQYMYAEYGVINYALSLFGISPIAWLSNSRLALPSIAIASVWYGVGWNVVVFLSGLQSIPIEYYEAARIDGASNWNCFVSITLPLLRRVLLFVGVVTIITQFRVFDLIFVMTEGGPGTATMVMMMYLYREAFMIFRMGTASAIAIILLLIVLVLSAIQLKLFGSSDSY